MFSEFKPWLLFDLQSLGAAGRFLLEFLQPAHSAEFLQLVLRETWQTVAIATAGLTLALAGAIPATLIVTERLSISRLGTGRMRPLARLLRQGVRWLLVLLRSVPELVWALLFVAIFGPGALAGTMAIAFRSIGFVGKLFGEALEETRPGPIEALKAAGAPWPSIFIKGYWPQVEPAFWAIALFRWDISVRESAVLGLVGAGGIGMAINAAMDLFQWERVALMLVTIFVVVIVAEVAVTYIRKKII